MSAHAYGTQRATQLGDAARTAALAARDRIVGRHVTAWRGKVVKFTGDGLLATFDGRRHGQVNVRVQSETR